jgi:hypothetical protein
MGLYPRPVNPRPRNPRPPLPDDPALPVRKLTPAAARALAEAEARRAAQAAKEAALAKTRERDGRGGKDPVRYDDWEVKGLAADF